MSMSRDVGLEHHRSEKHSGRATPLDTEWEIVTASVIGALHERYKLPNQDCVAAFPHDERPVRPPIILGIADGHGNARNYRSEVGSQIAVQVAQEVLGDYCQGIGDPSGMPISNRKARQILPKCIVGRWRTRVKQHFQDHPVTDEEKRRWTPSRQSGRKSEGDIDYKAYGTTLSAVLVHSEFLLFVSIGDGSLIAVDEEAEVWRPIDENPRHFANETTSLCSDTAEQDFSVHLHRIERNAPALILLCTDGYADSFKHDDLENVCREFVEWIREQGTDRVRQELEELLEETSRKGSGDDTTVGMLYRLDSAPSRWPDWRKAKQAERHAIPASASGNTTATQRPPRDLDARPDKPDESCAVAGPTDRGPVPSADEQTASPTDRQSPDEQDPPESAVPKLDDLPDDSHTTPAPPDQPSRSDDS